MKNGEKRQILVDHYLDFYGMAFAILQNDDDAKDVVQDSLIVTLVKHHVEDPKAFCMQVVYNKSISVLRRRSRFRRIGNMDLMRSTHINELAEEAMELKEHLPEVSRAMVELHDMDGMTYEEVALVSGCSTTTVRRIVSRAHDYMKKKMED